ncbi:Acyl-CoA-binding protein, ACBP [Metarhizium rileyi]|uniref:Acyl-CoA-binding protein, ACBP n=1 Tax=Metarhizium rileyi (strain RCEF 4871) TaxID=1649241 RepID=A0A167H9N1_METRR|nr:Acyl-CoA-binding protein, ACBP [Metarhizium rileyi RCEF 4871]TWU76582.1 hypothetical protein ED733_007982 [Metarhizium rileyi]
MPEPERRTFTSNELFNETADFKATQLENPSNNQKLELYGLYKIGTGCDITKEPKPGMFNIEKKMKLGRWQDKVNEGLTVETAQEKYIEFVERVKNDPTFMRE